MRAALRVCAATAVMIAACFVKPERVATVDASGDGPLPTNCMPAPCQDKGGSCVADVCEIDATSATTSVTCPSDMKCRVLCGADECKDGVKCADATECDVRCIGDAACQNSGVDCEFANVCIVRCIGASACQHGPMQNLSVQCKAAACTVTCDGANACQEGIDADTDSCTSHCCSGACQNGTATACANNDMTCT